LDEQGGFSLVYEHFRLREKCVYAQITGGCMFR
jgi:hypothetical protein